MSLVSPDVLRSQFVIIAVDLTPWMNTGFKELFKVPKDLIWLTHVFFLVNISSLFKSDKIRLLSQLIILRTLLIRSNNHGALDNWLVCGCIFLSNISNPKKYSKKEIKEQNKMIITIKNEICQSFPLETPEMWSLKYSRITIRKCSWAWKGQQTPTASTTVLESQCDEHGYTWCTTQNILNHA